MVAAACGGRRRLRQQGLVEFRTTTTTRGGDHHDSGGDHDDHRAACGAGRGDREDGEHDARDVLVDASGKTLYAFANDQGTTSACTGGCATIWPPLMATGTPTGGSGVDAAKLSAAPSGQVVYNGHLLYTYAQDTAAGETNGQGVGGVWHVVAPSGDIIS